MPDRHSRSLSAVALLGAAALAVALSPVTPIAFAVPPVKALKGKSGPEYIPGKYIVVLKNGVQPMNEAARLARRFQPQGMSVGSVFDKAIPGFAAFVPDRVVASLKRDPAVKYIDRDQAVHPAVLPKLKADLTVLNAVATPTKVKVGESVKVDVTIGNTGPNTSLSLAVAVYRHLTSKPGLGLPADATAYSQHLPPGGVVTLSTEVKYTSAGTFSLWARSVGVFPLDLDLGNDCFGPIQIIVDGPAPPPPPGNPDLQITSFTTDLTDVIPGQNISVDVTVKNNGNGPAGNFDVSLYRHATAAPDTNTPKDATQTVNGLAAGAETTLNFLIAYPKLGTFQLRGLCDSNGQVNEGNENDNPGGPVMVHVHCPDPPTPPPGSTQVIPTGIRRTCAHGGSAIPGDGQGAVNVTLAIIDTGCDITHPDLNVVLRHHTIGSNDDDNHGHGTHVAGTAAARDNLIGVVGMCPGARIVGVKVLDPSGTTATVIAGINFVIGLNGGPNQCAVANMSLGGGFSQALNDAVKNAVNNGIVMCVAAGNSSADAINGSPSSEPTAITVAALADSDGKPGKLGPPTGAGPDDTFATFSNFGSICDVIAPGVNILSTWRVNAGSYNTISGTSMACPHVCGLCALIKANNPGLTPAQVLQAVTTESIETIPGINGENPAINYVSINAQPF